MAQESAVVTAGVTDKQRCPICLEDFEDKTFIDPCFHIHNHCSDLFSVFLPF